MGYLVLKVASSSPAAQWGLRPSRISASIAGQDVFIGGDIILALDGVEISSTMMAEVRERSTDRNPGVLIDMKVLRDGRVIVLKVPFYR